MKKRIDLDELKKIQIEILDEVADFCEKNDIKYFLDAGTLLGAVRHKGYIPWDDDIDICMLREDYDRFIVSFNQFNIRYQAYCVENNRDFLYPYCKVLDTNTVLYEPDRKGNKISVNIDVFPLDNAPYDMSIFKKMCDKRTNLRKYDAYLNSDISNKSFIKKTIIRIARLMIPKYYFILKFTKLEKKYNGENTGYVSSFSGYYDCICSKDAFASYVNVEFEGKKYKAPIGYDDWLKCLYGDYMELPPKEKQVSHHTFEAYYK